MYSEVPKKNRPTLPQWGRENCLRGSGHGSGNLSDVSNRTVWFSHLLCELPVDLVQITTQIYFCLFKVIF